VGERQKLEEDLSKQQKEHEDASSKVYAALENEKRRLEDVLKI